MNKAGTFSAACVMMAWTDGKPVEFRKRGQNTVAWLEMATPDEADLAPRWDWITYEYRLKKAKPDSVNWAHVHPDFNYIARDSNGAVYAYTRIPVIVGGANFWSIDAGSDGIAAKVTLLASYQHGDCDWQDSLLVRPEADT